jgi:cobalamin biosynthesis Mg chelatase CobN
MLLTYADVKARNVGGFATGELAEMLAAGNAVRIPLERYRSWLDELAPQLRDKGIADWGDPADVELMAERG